MGKGEARLIIAGSRGFSAYNSAGGVHMRHLRQVFEEISWCAREFGAYDRTEDCFVEVVSGKEPKGADRLGEAWAYLNRIPVKPFPADWPKHGKAAGFIRNSEMARYAAQFDGSLLIAFWDGESRGTNHMIKEAERLNLYVHIARIKG